MWETQSAPSAIATAISVNTRPGECTHGPAYVSANAAVTPAVSPVSRASSRSIPTPACDTTPTPSALTFTRRDRLLRFTREVSVPYENPDPKQVPVFLKGQALRPIYHSCRNYPRETLGLAEYRSALGKYVEA
jgi:hypothetical protein